MMKILTRPQSMWNLDGQTTNKHPDIGLPPYGGGGTRTRTMYDRAKTSCSESNNAVRRNALTKCQEDMTCFKG